MKSLGWYLFFALLMADVVAGVMLRLAVSLNIVLTVSVLVFAILAIVMLFASHSNARSKRREAQAQAKVAELQSKVDNQHKEQPKLHISNEPSVENT